FDHDNSRHVSNVHSSTDSFGAAERGDATGRLAPPDGAPYLHVQTVGGPPRVHVDLVGAPGREAVRLEQLGAARGPTPGRS
ncbi:MAG TPA: hypothetical protein VFY38_16240, partial [Pseudonocardia sp.]|nr:hypothetical protein [Pseudonocardia sp.]